LRGKVDVVFEEGARSAWLYQLTKPLMASVTVCDPRHNKLIGDGDKSDYDNAGTLARLLRMGEVKAVYKGDQQRQKLTEVEKSCLIERVQYRSSLLRWAGSVSSVRIL
jgi:hypothetical protein